MSNATELIYKSVNSSDQRTLSYVVYGIVLRDWKSWKETPCGNRVKNPLHLHFSQENFIVPLIAWGDLISLLHHGHVRLPFFSSFAHESKRFFASAIGFHLILELLARKHRSISTSLKSILLVRLLAFLYFLEALNISSLSGWQLS